jgi:N-acetylmuramoyl-L-alanine amidase
MRIKVIMITLLCCFAGWLAYGQSTTLKLKQPVTSFIEVSQNRYFIQGTAHPNATLIIQQDTIPIYSTGVFAAAIDLAEGLNHISLAYRNAQDSLSKQITIHYTPPKPPQATTGFAIEYVKLIPEGDLWLRPGDLIQVEMKGTPGQTAYWMGDVPLQEVDSAEVGVKGVYRGTYTLQDNDLFQQKPLAIRLLSATNQNIEKWTTQKVTVLHPQQLRIGRIKNPSTPLYYSIGTDRLGGATMGTLDTGVYIEITGRVANLWKIRLTDRREAYVRTEHVQILAGGQFRPQSLMSSWQVKQEGGFDVVQIALEKKLPYLGVEQSSPSRISIDVFGAQSNTTWIAQKENLLALEKVWFEQIEKDVVRIHLDLKSPYLWGYAVQYQGNHLVIKVKPQPKQLSLSGLTIGLDPGHGGSNVGATGMTGAREKALNLAIALHVRKLLQSKGAKVLMTRQTDTSVPNALRLSMMRNAWPDLVLSIHCNASANPMAQGTSTFFKHPVYKDLSFALYESLTELPLAPYGSIGQFNFVMNSATEFPSSLIEVGFLSNPYDESKLVDPNFQREVAEAIVRGIENFLLKAHNANLAQVQGSDL